MHNRRKSWDGKERRSVYTGEEHRSGEDRRDKFDRNVYGRLSVLDQFKDIGVFRVNPRTFTGEKVFLEPAWVYDRRDKNYQEWNEDQLARLIRTTQGNEENLRAMFHNLGSRDLLEGMYVG